MEEIGIPPPPKERRGLFGQQKPMQQDVSSFAEDIGNLSRRLRLLEESFGNLRRSLQLTEQNMLSKNKSFSTEIRTTASDIGEIKKELNDVKEKILEMVSELETNAKKEEVKILEKYINMWNPIKFVTQNEVEQIVKEILEKNKQKKE